MKKFLALLITLFGLSAIQAHSIYNNIPRSAEPFPNEPDYSGVYEIHGTVRNQDEELHSYTGIATIRKHGKIWSVQTFLESGTYYKGFLVEKDGKFTYPWIIERSPVILGVTIFERKGRNFIGAWYDKDGVWHSETLYYKMPYPNKKEVKEN